MLKGSLGAAGLAGAEGLFEEGCAHQEASLDQEAPQLSLPDPALIDHIVARLDDRLSWIDRQQLPAALTPTPRAPLTAERQEHAARCKEVFRQSIRSLYVTGRFLDLPDEIKMHPEVQARVIAAQPGMDEAVFGTARLLESLGPRDHRAIQATLRDHPDLGEQLASLLEAPAREDGIPFARRMSVRATTLQLAQRMASQPWLRHPRHRGLSSAGDRVNATTAPPERFRGRTLVVTGGARGLGRALALGFAREGGHVVVACRARTADAEETTAAIRAEGGSATPATFDIRDAGAVARAFDAILAERGTIDVLVNSAGISQDGLFPLLDEAGWNDVVQTNLLGTVRCCRAVVSGMWKRRAGAIVNVASVAAMIASPGLTSYASSKGGVLALTRSLAAELAPKGIRVNAVVPGLLATGMVTRLDARVVADRQQRIPLGRLGDADEVARAVLFLASDEATYIVGHALVVDGGMSL